MAKNTAVFGLYASANVAENAVDQLLVAGFNNSDISVLLPDDETTRAFAHEKHTKAPEGAATGVTAGGVIGGTLGLLAGIGVLAIPGVGPLIAAGPILGALAGLGAGGAVGGLVGALVGMGIPEFEAKRYEGAVKGGGTLLSVHCETSEEVSLAKQTLKDTGARDISSSGEAGSSNEYDREDRIDEARVNEAATVGANGTSTLDPYERGIAEDRDHELTAENVAATGLSGTAPRYPGN